MSSAFEYPSFAKINLNLKVLGKRQDGFHEICTTFQTVDLKDKIYFEPADTLEMVCDEPGIPIGEGNLVIKAARSLIAETGADNGARIVLKKRIPSPGGLGGGSSNAAVALIGLRRLWNLDLSLDDLARIGAVIGSDVPFFFYGGTALGTGRGTSILRVPDVIADHVLIATPDAHISTPEAYSELQLPYLTKEKRKSILKHYRRGGEAAVYGEFGRGNDFEKVIYGKHQIIENAAEVLSSQSATSYGLSGSGPSVFGFFRTAADADSAQSKLRHRGYERLFRTRTVPAKEYAQALGLGDFD